MASISLCRIDATGSATRRAEATESGTLLSRRIPAACQEFQEAVRLACKTVKRGATGIRQSQTTGTVGSRF